MSFTSNLIEKVRELFDAFRWIEMSEAKQRENLLGGSFI